MYLGWRHRRVDGPEYDDFVDRFVQAVRAELPHVLLQWEDFATPARAARSWTATGTSCSPSTTTSRAPRPWWPPRCPRPRSPPGPGPGTRQIVMLGAGSAGIGVCDQIVRSMIADGLSEQGGPGPDLRGQRGRPAHRGPPGDQPGAAPLRPPGRGRARPGAAGHRAGLIDVVRAVRPTALIGLSTATGAFTEDVVRDHGRPVRRPIIMPLSNPTSRSEARPQDLADWTGGRALVAAGSPFPPMKVATRAEHPGSPVQQRVRVPGRGPGRDRGPGHPDHRRDDDRRGLGHLRRRHDPRGCRAGCCCPTGPGWPRRRPRWPRAVARAAVDDGVAPGSAGRRSTTPCSAPAGRPATGRTGPGRFSLRRI